jgi:hypothetical protein
MSLYSSFSLSLILSHRASSSRHHQAYRCPDGSDTTDDTTHDTKKTQHEHDTTRWT